jgi:hypothetical protein
MGLFDNAQYQGFDEPTWDLTANWAPLSYSQLTLSIARDVMPTIASDNLRASDRYRLNWVHNWSPRVTSQLFGALENADNKGIGRQDDYTSFGADLSYGIRRWLGVGINYTYRSLKSDDPTVDFTQNAVMFYVTGNPRISGEAKTPWATWY